MEVPALDGGDFSRLTITGQLRIVEEQAAGEPVNLMGSSLGGYLAALYASRHPETGRVVLLAPAFEFPSRFVRDVGPERAEAWRREGSLPFFHYGAGVEMRLGYQLIEDAAQYPDYPSVAQPTLILHGAQDEVVPASLSQEFVRRHPHARLRILPSDHQLTDVLVELWQETASFWAE